MVIIVITKEMLINDLASVEGVSATSIRHLYDEFERIVFDRLSSTTPTEKTVVKLFNGLSIECKYYGADVTRHPATGKQIMTPEKIWAKASLTRNYNRKLNKNT